MVRDCASLVDRPRLSPEAASNAPFSIIAAVAPAGYGKTILIDQWRYWAAGRAMNCITLRDVADIERVEVALAMQEPLLLLVDDIHAAPAAVRSLVRKLIDIRPQFLRMLVAGREATGIGLARASLSGTVRSINQKELRFTPDETADWLRERGIVSDPAVRSYLDRAVGGWPAAIVFATPLIGDPNISMTNFLSRMCRSNTPFAHYVEEEILAPLAPDASALMVETAPLRTFEISLCKGIAPTLYRNLPAMVEQGLLDEQERGGHVSYMHHPLVAEYLEQRLARDEPDHLARIHNRAMTLYSDAGKWVEALPHAFAVGKLDTAIDMLAQASARHQRIGRWRDFTNWVQRLDPEVVAGYPQIAVEVACAYAVLFEARKARGYIDDLQKNLPHLSQAVQNDLLVARALVATFSDQPKEALVAGRTGIENFSGDDQYSIGTLHAATAFGLIARGQLAEAREALKLARAAQEEGGSPFGLSIVLALTGLTYAKQADADTAFLIWKQGDDAAKQMPTTRLVSAVVLGYAAELHYDRNEIDAAEQLIEKCLDDSIEVALPDTVRSLYLTRARIAFLRGCPHEAAYVLEEAAAIALRRDWPQLQNAVAWERVNFALRNDRIADASEIASAIPQGAPDWEAETLGRLHLRAILNTGRETIRAIHAAVVQAASQNLAVTAMRLRTIEAIARELSGDRLGALRTFRLAADAAIAGRFVRPILDCGPTATSLMRHLLSEVPENRSIYAPLIEAPEALLATQADEEQIIEQLSHRELDIVGGIAEGLTNAQIGRRLLLSENTVKWHLQHVFAKLGVSNRTRALVVARQNGLLN